MTTDLDATAKTQTESRGSVAYEFNDTELVNAPLTDRMLAQLKEHAPSWLRERLSTPEHTKLNDPAALATCLLAQARVLLTLKRYQDAIPKVTEAEQLYQNAGVPLGVADCYHVAARIHESLGEPDKAFDFLRREEELRRRLAA
jgi:hypothetical protein